MSARAATRFVQHTRLVCLAGLVLSLAMAGSRVLSQAGQTIGGYQLVSEEMLKGQTSRLTYRATLSNAGGALSAATATITGSYGSVKIVDRSLTFGAVGAGGSVLSSDTFALERKTGSRFDLSTLIWAITTTSNHAPVANAGPDLTRYIGETAQLDGSASTDQDGNGLTYSWSFVSRPAGSLATLSSPTAVKPTFVVDRSGSYLVRLVVNDGFVNSTADTVTVTTLNSPPVANAGPDQTAFVQQQVTLNGSGSSDVDGNALSFSWSFVSRPTGSAAVLTNPTVVTPTFVVDRSGTYVVRLIVNDGFVSSSPDTVSITTQNSPPVANAGPDQSVFVTNQVTLDGSGSTDVDGNPLTYSWALIGKPPFSAATLSDPSAIRPTFVVDKPGTYVAQLMVNDGGASSAADTVTITTENSAPVGRAGPDQTVVAGQLVLLDGRASSDADNDPLTFRWSFTTRPPGSQATLNDPDTQLPSFVVDRPGTFVLQLITNDGFVDSAPDTITVTTTNTTPVANAGPDQPGAVVGSLATLDGTLSRDPDPGQFLIYSWSLLSRPPTSLATLDASTVTTPTFTPDVAGDYVAQLIVSDGYVDSAPDTTVIHANSPPLANAGPDQQVTVGDTVYFDGNGSSDPDGSPLTYSWQLTFTPSGSLAALQNPTSVSPNFVADLSGDYVVQLTVTDVGGTAATDSVLVVASSAPAIAPVITVNPLDQSVVAGGSVTFSASATGAPAPTAQWQMSSDGGATFTDLPAATSPVLTFAVQATDDGKRYRAVFSNIAGSATSSIATLTVTNTVNVVNESIRVGDAVIVNGAPMLSPLVNRTVDPLTLVQFTAVAVDPGDALMFTLDSAPAGATIGVANGIFNWTPTAVQAPGTYPFVVRVTDSGGLSATQPITITVRPFVNAVNEFIRVDDAVIVNAAPLLSPLVNQTVDPLTLVQFTAVAVDPGDALMFTLDSAPAGATIGVASGTFNWTPTAAQAPGTYPFLVRVTDSGGLTSTQPITITVRRFVHAVDDSIRIDDAVIVNGAPMLSPLVNRTVDPLTLVQFTAVAVDPGDALMFTLESAPAGAAIDVASGTFNWTPTTAQAPGTYPFVVRVTDSSGLSAAQPITITVRPFINAVDDSILIDDAVIVNGAPLLSPLVNQTVDPLTLVQFTAVAVDPGDTLMFTLESAPAGAAIDVASGTFNWTPTAAQAPGTYPFVVRVTDSGGLSAAQPITIRVRPFVHAVDDSIRIDDAVIVNGAPLLSPLVNQTVDALTLVQFTAVAADPGDTLSFTLDNAPAGAAIDATSGAFTWTPTAAQAAGSYPFLVRATDSGGLSATQSMTITVRPFYYVIEERISLSDTAEVIPIASVTLDSADPSSSETGADPGLVRVSRTGDTSSALTVAFTFGGTATSGDDYQTINGTITIPSGQVSADLVVTPIDDALIEGQETVVITLNATADYQVGPVSTATVTIADNELIVTNVRDNGSGSLRQAMLDANAHAGTDTIVFDIPGNGPHTITPASPLPTITDPVIVDGTTQPGYATQHPIIELDGSLAGPAADGLVITAGNTTISGLVLNRFGTGGVGPGGSAVVIQGAGNNVIQSNFIGTDSTGSIARANRGAGVLIDGSSSNVIGDAAGLTQANTIAFNGGAGVSILSGSGNAVYANSIFSNTGLAIDLGGDGVTQNDPADTDGGPNNLQNFPILTSALSSGGTTSVHGTLHSEASTPFTLQFFANTTCHSSGHGDGTTLLGSQLFSTDAAGDLAFDVSWPISTATGQFITATATQADGSTSEFSACADVNPFLALTPDPLNLSTADTRSLTVTLSHVAGVGGTNLTLTSSDLAVATVAPTISVPEGTTTTTVDVTAGVAAGNATITAAAAGFASANSQAVVSLRTMTLAASSPLVAVGQTLDWAISLDQPAPIGGVTITLASSDDSFVSVSPATVTIAAGDLAATFTIAGIAGGSATISASAAGFASANLPITATTSSLISLGSAVVVAPGQNVGLPLSLGTPAPAGGVTVSLSSTDASIATVTPTVFIPEGLQIPAANPTVHGVAIGSAHVIATATGLAPDTASVVVTLSIALAPNPLNVIQGVTANATLSLSSPAPAGGLTFDTSIDNPALATTGATVQVDAGATSVPVPVTALLVGDTTLRVSAPGITGTTITISVKAAPVITVGDATIGKDLQASMSGTLGAAAPAGNLQVTIASLSPSSLLLSTTPTAAGTSSIVLTVGAGSNVIPTFYLQALTATGSATIQTSASGYATDASSITFRPAGFLIASGNITTNTSSANTQLQIVSEYLNPAGTNPPTYVRSGVRQAIRSGLSVDVLIASSNTSVGRMVSVANSSPIDHVTFDAGDSSATAAFDPVGPGTAIISLSVPSGFEAATTGQQIQATVNTSPTITVANATIGKDLQIALGGTLGAPAPAGNLDVTITSLDPTKVLLSTTPTPAPNQPAGFASLTFFVGAGSGAIPTFYVQALTDTGTALIQTTAPNYATDTSTITLRPSGFLLLTGNITTTAISPNAALTVVAEYLNPTGSNPPTYVRSGIQQALRAGLSVDVSLASSDPTVGTIVAGVSNSTPVDHVSFNGGEASRTAAFDPIGGGIATISLTQPPPPGFYTATTLQQITATVTAPAINLNSSTIGKDLQAVLGGSLGAAVPTGSSVDVTITSLDPSKVLLSTTATPAANQPAGFTSITLTVGAGSSSIPNFYAQALTDSGTATLQATAPGYTSDTSTLTLRPSGFLLSTASISTTTFSGNTGLTMTSQFLNPAATNPPTFVASGIAQGLRAGLSVDVAIASSDPNVGKIVTSISNSTPIDHVTFTGGVSTRTAAFDPLTGGTTDITLTTPAGFTTATTGQRITATVTAPNITIGSVVVGRDLQTTVFITLAAPPPSPVDVIVNSNNAAIATITRNGAVEGGSTVTFTGITSTTVGSFVVQGRSIGNTTITVQASGYNDGTSNVTVNPSGFYIQTGAVSTTTFGPNRAVVVAAAALNPTTLVTGTTQPVRGGLSVSVSIASANANVGTIVTNDVNETPLDHLTFNAGDTSKTVAFAPAGIVAATTIGIGTAAGFATPSNGQSISASVTTPDITVTSSATVGRDLQVLMGMNLTVAPPSGVTLTVTSNDDTIAKLTTVANKTSEGVTALVFNNVTSTSTLSFYVQGFQYGTTTLTVHATGYDDATSSITVNPSGFYIVTGAVTTTASAANTTVSVGPALLHPVTLNFVAGQQLRGGLSSVAVGISSSNPSVGTIVGSLVFSGGDLTKSVAFDPAAVGTTTIGIATPAGFTLPSNRQSIAATVNP